MADSEAASQDKTKEKKKKKVGSAKEKEPRKKSGTESDLQPEAKPPAAETEPSKAQQPADVSDETPAQETPADPAAAPDSTKKSRKSKSAAKPEEGAAPDANTDGRKASIAENATRKASTAEGAATPGASASRKASAAAPAPAPAPEEGAEGESEGPARKPVSDELPPPIEGTYVVPPAATKKDIDLLQDLDENKLMELKEAFELFDYDQDGFIDYKDLKLTYQTLGYPDVPDDDIANMLAEAINPLDFDAFVILLGYKTIEMDPEAVLIEALACWDYDNSGLISEDRIKHDLMTWGDKFTTEEAEQALEDAPIYAGKKGASMIDYIKFSNTLCGLRKKTRMTAEPDQDDP